MCACCCVFLFCWISQIVNESLTSLDLGYNEIKDQGAYALAQAIKNNGNGVLSEIKLNNNVRMHYSPPRGSGYRLFRPRLVD